MTTTPVYTTGPGLPGTALSVAIGAGLTGGTDDTGNAAYTSADGTFMVDFGPESDDYASGGPLWTAAWHPAHDHTDPQQCQQAHREGWTATFGDNTPTLAIAAFIAVLTGAAQQSGDNATGTDGSEG